MSKESLKVNKNPFLGVVESAIKIWIINRCKSIEHLHINLNGGIFELIKGYLQYVSLDAKMINFEGILLNSAKIRSDSIYFKLNLRSADNKIKFAKDFKIFAEVSIGENGINDCLDSKDWFWLKEWIGNNCLNTKDFERIVINNGKIKLIKESNSKIFLLDVLNRKLVLVNEKDNSSFYFPMDPAIHIIKAEVSSDEVLIKLESSVKA